MTIFVVSIQSSLNCLIATNDKLFCLLKLSHTLYFVLEWLRACSKYLCIYAQMSHISVDIQIRTFLKKNREQSFLFFALKFNVLVQSLSLSSSLSAAAFEFDICACRPMLFSLCFVWDLFCGRSPVMCFMQCTQASSSHARAISAFGLNSPNFLISLRFCKARV